MLAIGRAPAADEYPSAVRITHAVAHQIGQNAMQQGRVTQHSNLRRTDPQANTLAEGGHGKFGPQLREDVGQGKSPNLNLHRAGFEA